MKKIFENAVWWSGVVMVGLILGISLQFVRAWTEPTEAPPGGNVGAPINTGANAQWKGVWGDITKMGSLGISGALKTLGLQTDYFQMPTGAVAGYVLTTDALGNATWQPPTGGGSIPSGVVDYTTPGTYQWTAPAGVNAINLTAIGGGGGGCCTPAWAKGGQAGYVDKKFPIRVTPGTEYTIVVGRGGGQGYNFGVAGSPGTLSEVYKTSDSSTILAKGNAGAGAPAEPISNGTPYGFGGPYVSIIDDPTCNPGNGGSGYVKIEWGYSINPI